MNIKLIIEFEGYRDEAYQCSAGVWTIGYGHTDGVQAGDRITKAVALELLEHELEKFAGKVDQALNREPTANQRDAMVSLAYNVGETAFKTSTLVAEFNAGNTLGAAMEFQRWSLVRGRRSKGLLCRRLKEASLFLS